MPPNERGWSVATAWGNCGGEPSFPAYFLDLSSVFASAVPIWLEKGHQIPTIECPRIAGDAGRAFTVSRPVIVSGPAFTSTGFFVFDHRVVRRSIDQRDCATSILPCTAIPLRRASARLLASGGFTPRSKGVNLFCHHILLVVSVCFIASGLSTRLTAAPPEKADSDAAVESKPAPDQIPDDLTRWRKTGLPLMQTYCSDCHNEDLQEGGLDLSPFNDLKDLTSQEVKRVIEMVRFGAMPPEDYDEPETQERKQLVTALEATLFSSTCDLTPKAGKVTVRRLNRSEYNNTIRDLFGLDLHPADEFPSDEVGAGFDNNGDVLSLSPMLIEKYIGAAETVSKKVLIDPSDLPEINLNIPGDQLPIYGDPKIGRFGGRFVDPESFVWLDVRSTL